MIPYNIVQSFNFSYKIVLIINFKIINCKYHVYIISQYFDLDWIDSIIGTSLPHRFLLLKFVRAISGLTVVLLGRIQILSNFNTCTILINFLPWVQTWRTRAVRLLGGFSIVGRREGYNIAYPCVRDPRVSERERRETDWLTSNDRGFSLRHSGVRISDPPRYNPYRQLSCTIILLS